MTDSKNKYHLELKQKIKLLKLESHVQEDEIKLQFIEIIESIDPVVILKQSIVSLTSDNEIKIDIARLAINLGTNYAIDKILHKKKGVKDYIFSILKNRFSNSFVTKMITQFQ